MNHHLVRSPGLSLRSDGPPRQVGPGPPAFRRINNFACVEIHPQTRKLLVYLKTDPGSITLEPGFTRDVTKIGHFGTGNLEVAIGDRVDFERAQPLILTSYQAS
jgi:predicted transport protein